MMTVAPFSSLLGSILGQPVGIDRWSGLSELADHQDPGVWRQYKLQANSLFFFIYQSEANGSGLMKREPGALILEGMLHMWKPQQQQSRL